MSPAVGWLLRRVVGALAVVAASSLLLGALVRLAPGGGGDGLLTWFVGFWGGLLTGDLGASYRGMPVVPLVLRAASLTYPLVAGSAAIALGAAVLLTCLGEGRSRWLRWAAIAASLVPTFLLGYVALVFFAVPPEGPLQLLAGALALALGDGTLAELTEAVGRAWSEARDRDFVHTARLQGRSVVPVVLPHLALPVAAALSSRVAFLLGGVLVLEQVLGIPGLGRVGYQAAVQPDFTVLVAVAVLVTGTVVLLQLAVDLLRFWVDPRVRKDRRRAPRLPA